MSGEGGSNYAEMAKDLNNMAMGWIGGIQARKNREQQQKQYNEQWAETKKNNAFNRGMTLKAAVENPKNGTLNRNLQMRQHFQESFARQEQRKKQNAFMQGVRSAWTG